MIKVNIESSDKIVLEASNHKEIGEAPTVVISITDDKTTSLISLNKTQVKSLCRGLRVLAMEM